MLSRDIFQRVLKEFQFDPNIDGFATRVNAQLKTYASRHPDPYATQVDAFSFNWSEYRPYLFPPFSLLNRVLQKIRIDKATALCVVPRWTTQAWWPELLDMMVRDPMILPPSTKNLVLPNQKHAVHPLHAKLELVICLLSGTNIPQEVSHEQRQI